MVEISMPDGTYLSSIIANLNVFSSDPTTSKGAGEIIYQSTAGVLKVNTQTVAPTTNPTWTEIGSGGGSNLIADITDMNTQSFTNLLENGDFESWSNGAAAAPDGFWYAQNGTGGSVVRVADTKIKTYVSRITKSTVSSSMIVQGVAEYLRYSGRTMTYGVWVKSATTITDSVWINIYDGGWGLRTYYQNSGDWEWLTIVDTIQSTPVSLRVYNVVDTTSNATADFAGATLVEGSVCPAFSPKPLPDDGHSIQINSATNSVTLGRDPTIDAEAATKKYVDDNISVGDFMADGSVSMTGNLTINKVNPQLILYPTTAGSPAIMIKNSSDVLKGSIYQNTDDMVVLCEAGVLYLSTAATTGGNVIIETKGVARLTVGDTVTTCTDDLYINKTTPHVVLQEGGVLRGSVYIETDDSFVIDAASEDLTLVSASDNINVLPAGVVQAKFMPTAFVSYQDMNIDKPANPILAFYEGAAYRGAIGVGNSDEIIIQSEHGDILLGTFATTGGTIDINPKAGGVVASFDSSAIDFTVDLSIDKASPVIELDTNATSSFLKFLQASVVKGQVWTSNNYLMMKSMAGDLQLSSASSAGKNIDFVTNDVTRFRVADALITASVALAMSGAAITNAIIAGINNTSFILDQDNTGAGVSSSVRFNRGTTAADAAIWWDEGDDEFQFESVLSTTIANVKVANVAATKVVTGDHGTAATDEVVNVCYGTSTTPPTASTTTEGTLYIQYTA